MLFIYLITLVEAQSSSLDDLRTRIESGKIYYQAYTTANKCNEQVIASMLKKCDEMNEDVQSEFALKLTNCHLERVGFPLFECTHDNLNKCQIQMDQNTFLAYTQFFTHAFDLCVYLSFTT